MTPKTYRHLVDASALAAMAALYCSGLVRTNAGLAACAAAGGAAALVAFASHVVYRQGLPRPRTLVAQPPK